MQQITNKKKGGANHPSRLMIRQMGIRPSSPRLCPLGGPILATAPNICGAQV